MRRAVWLLPFLLAGCSTCDDLPWVLEWDEDAFDAIAAEGAVPGTYAGHGLPTDAPPGLDGGTLFMVQVETETPTGFLTVEGHSAHWLFDGTPTPETLRQGAQGLAGMMGLGDGFVADVTANAFEDHGRWFWDSNAPLDIDVDTLWTALGAPDVASLHLGRAMARVGDWDLHFELPVATTEWTSEADGVQRLVLSADRTGLVRYEAWTDFGLGDQDQQAAFRAQALTALGARLDGLGVGRPADTQSFGPTAHC